MNGLFELINSNMGGFYLVIYLFVILVSLVVFIIYKKCNKNESSSEVINEKEYSKISDDILLAESFGNEPLSRHDFHNVINNGAISRKKSKVCLNPVLELGRGDTI